MQYDRICNKQINISSLQCDCVIVSIQNQVKHMAWHRGNLTLGLLNGNHSKGVATDDAITTSHQAGNWWRLTNGRAVNDAVVNDRWTVAVDLQCIELAVWYGRVWTRIELQIYHHVYYYNDHHHHQFTNIYQLNKLPISLLAESNQNSTNTTW